MDRIRLASRAPGVKPLTCSTPAPDTVAGDTLKDMIATSTPTMLLIFAVASGIVTTFVLTVHHFIGKAK